MGFYGNATYYLPNGIAQDVVDGVITTKKLADNAVTAEKIADGQVHGSGNNDKSPNYDHIASKSIGTDDIADNAVTGGAELPFGRSIIAPNTITGYNIDYGTIDGSGDENGLDDMEFSHIGENTIGLSNMGKDSVGEKQIINNSMHGTGDNESYPDYQHIAPGSIGANDIAYEIITGSMDQNQGHIAPHTITGYNIDYGTIDGSGDENGLDDMEFSHIGENTIGLSNMGKDSIGVEQIINSSIHGTGDNEDYPAYSHIAYKSIGNEDIADQSINRQHINNLAVHREHIAGHAIQGLASNNALILTDGTKKSHIAPESIAGGENGDIAPDTITNYNIAPGTITENKLANKFLKIAHYTDQEIPTTLQEICSLLRQSYGGTNTLVTFSLGNSNDINSAVYNGLTPGDYQAYPALMNGSNGAPGYWYLHNLSTDEHWKIETYTRVLNKIYLNDYIDTNLKEYDSIIELKNDLDQHPMKTYIIGVQQAMSNLPSGRYIALPTHEHIGSMKSNRILIHLTTGISYTLRTTSANTVIVSTYTGHPNTNSEWLTFNQFNETEEIMINGQSYGSGKIMLYNQYQYKDLPIYIWNWTYLVAQLNLSTFNDENKSFTTKCIIAGKLPAIGSIKNTTGKQLQFSTGQKIPSGASLNLPNPKDLEGNEIIDSELIKDYGYQIYMELVDFDSDTILCNIQYFQGLNRDLFPGAIIS